MEYMPNRHYPQLINNQKLNFTACEAPFWINLHPTRQRPKTWKTNQIFIISHYIRSKNIEMNDNISESQPNEQTPHKVQSKGFRQNLVCWNDVVSIFPTHIQIHVPVIPVNKQEYTTPARGSFV